MSEAIEALMARERYGDAADVVLEFATDDAYRRSPCREIAMADVIAVAGVVVKNRRGEVGGRYEGAK